MLNSKNLVSKLFLAVAMLSGLSLNCAQANATSTEVEAFTLAEEAYKALPNTSQASFLDDLPKLSNNLQEFAKAYIATEKIATRDDVKQALNRMANGDFAKKPVVQALISKLNFENPKNLIMFLANPSANLGLARDKDENILSVFGVKAKLSLAELGEDGGTSKLMHASYSNNVNEVKYLLSMGANANYKDHFGTALKYAESHSEPVKYKEVIEILTPLTDQ